MTETRSNTSAAAASKQPAGSALGKGNLLNFLVAIITPTALVLSLWSVAVYFKGAIPPAYLLLSVLVFALTFPGESRLQKPLRTTGLNIFLNWTWIAAPAVSYRCGHRLPTRVLR